jgi:hypothetical protein
MEHVLNTRAVQIHLVRVPLINLVQIQHVEQHHVQTHHVVVHGGEIMLRAKHIQVAALHQGQQDQIKFITHVT